MSCPGPGCDTISTSAGGAVGVKGLNAVDSGSLPMNTLGDIEPADQGLCAGNGYVVETNNIGEILVFNQRLHRVSSPIPDDTVMGLTGRGWSSGGDPSCLYDSSNGGHWIFTEIVSANSDASGGPFTGCFAGAAQHVLRGHRGDARLEPIRPVQRLLPQRQLQPERAGLPYLLNDFAKISTTRDAFLLFYDEFPLDRQRLASAVAFNGAQEFAFNKNALEEGRPVSSPTESRT